MLTSWAIGATEEWAQVFGRGSLAEREGQGIGCSPTSIPAVLEPEVSSWKSHQDRGWISLRPAAAAGGPGTERVGPRTMGLKLQKGQKTLPDTQQLSQEVVSSLPSMEDSNTDPWGHGPTVCSHILLLWWGGKILPYPSDLPMASPNPPGAPQRPQTDDFSL